MSQEKKKRVVAFTRGRKNFVSYEEAQTIAQKAGVKTFAQWIDYCHGTGNFEQNQKPGNVPANPNLYYGPEGSAEWVDWGTFLGTGNIANNKKREGFCSYEECREFCHSQNIRSIKQWRKVAEDDFARPAEIPSAPNIVYAETGWTSWSDFLLPKFLDYEAAKRTISTMRPRIKTSSGWRSYSSSGKRPGNIPANPERYYKDKGWKNWPDFLGTDRAPRTLSYEEAQNVVAEKRITTKAQYNQWMESEETSQSLPKNPEEFYKKKGWSGWAAFLAKAKALDFADYSEAKNIVEKVGPKSAAQWNSLVKAIHYVEKNKGVSVRAEIVSPKLPDNPRSTYSDKGWTNWSDYLLAQDEVPLHQAYKKKKSLGKTPLEKASIEQSIKLFISEVMASQSRFDEALASRSNKESEQSAEKVAFLFSKYAVKSLDDWKSLVATIYKAGANSKQDLMEIFFENLDLDIERYMKF